jgi:transposase
MNSDRFILFLEPLIKVKDRKIYLILDNLRVHWSKIVKEWATHKKEQIELFYLPSYSLKKNPDEYLIFDLKQGLSIKPSTITQGGLEDNLKEYMDYWC